MSNGSFDKSKRILATKATEQDLFLNFFVKNGKLDPELLEQHLIIEGEQHITLIYDQAFVDVRQLVW